MKHEVAARLRILVPLAIALALVLAAPAQAGKVIVAGGGKATVKNDPAVPSRADTETEPPSVRASKPVARTSSARGRRAVAKGLRTAIRRKSISRKAYRSYTRTYASARRTLKRLRGSRARELGYVVATLERLAIRRRLTKTRMPALFLQLRNNTRYWRKLPFPAARGEVTFRGSEIVYTYYPGEGLQIQPLTTFKKANAMHGACVRGEGCRRSALRKLLDETTKLAVRRSRAFIAWEYNFDFGGGAPPWMSGMAQATAIQAYGRASQLLKRPSYLRTARKALPAFEAAPPVGVRTRGFRGGPHYLQYSFAPRLYIYNAFLQSIIGLYDYADITGDSKAEALWRAAEPEARREIPASDLGDWSMYSYGGRTSDQGYHELLREFLNSMCSRLKASFWCTYARRYRAYQTQPAEIEFLGPDTATRGRVTSVRFSTSKLAAVQVIITKGGATSLNRTATFRRGNGGFSWKPGGTGIYRVTVAAKELRTGKGLKSRTTAEIEVASP